MQSFPVKPSYSDQQNIEKLHKKDLSKFVPKMQLHRDDILYPIFVDNLKQYHRKGQMGLKCKYIEDVDKIDDEFSP